LNHGLIRTSRSRRGLNSALAAVREGDTLVVPKLDRLARSVPDAGAIGDSLAVEAWTQAPISNDPSVSLPNGSSHGKSGRAGIRWRFLHVRVRDALR
jgi:hypothetical protein